MPADELVVSDTSPLLNLALVDRLDLLERQFDSITAPEQVWEELTEGGEECPGLGELREQGFLSVIPVERTELYVEIEFELDEGETAAITYAVENEANLLLLDERDGRRVARRHDVNVTGVIGILLRGHATMTSTWYRSSMRSEMRDFGFPTTSTPTFSTRNLTSPDGPRALPLGEEPRRYASRNRAKRSSGSGWARCSARPP